MTKAGNDCLKLPLKKITKEDQEDEEATAGVAATKEISVGAAVSS